MVSRSRRKTHLGAVLVVAGLAAASMAFFHASDDGSWSATWQLRDRDTPPDTLRIAQPEGVWPTSNPSGSPTADPIWPGLEPEDSSPTTQPTEPDAEGEPAVSGRFTLDIYGDTPSLAWSPSGTHLAFVQAYSPSYSYLYPGGYPAGSREAIGIYAVDVPGGHVRHLVEGPGFHPAWLDDDRLVYACSAAMLDCDDGVFRVDLEGVEEKLIPMGSMLVYAASAVEIIYLNYEYQWLSRNLETGRVSPIYGSTYGYYGDRPPPGYFVEQCQQNVGDTRAYAVPAEGFYVAVGSNPPVQLTDEAPYFMGDPTYGIDMFNAPVPPCLSPDGSWVAFVTQLPEAGRMRLHITPVPR